MERPTEHERHAIESRDETEQRREPAARADAVRRANARGPGANLEEAVRMIRAGEAMHGVARQ